MSITTAPWTPLPIGTWTSDLVRSSVTFSIVHRGSKTFRGGFARFSADLTVNLDGTARLRGSARPNSLVIEARRLADEGLFDSGELRFESSTIRRDGDFVELDGRLTIKGRTLAVAATGAISDPDDDHRVWLELTTAFDRRQFGLTWNRPLPGGGHALGNEVRIEVRLALRRP